MEKKTLKKVAILGGIAVLVALFFILDLGQYLSLEYLKQSQASFQESYQNNKFLFLGTFFIIYVATAALSLPGAAILTLAGGGLFGFWTGLIVVSFASTVGATLACAVSRYILGSSVQEKFGDKLRKFNEGIDKEGAFYLFTLRLIPIFPFFVINLVMGLTKMRLLTFYWVSQLGMLPGTAVYVNAGKEISKLDSLSGILSPGLIISFVLLGVFPLVAKKGIAYYRKKKGLAEASGA